MSELASCHNLHSLKLEGNFNNCKLIRVEALMALRFLPRATNEIAGKETCVFTDRLFQAGCGQSMCVCLEWGRVTCYVMSAELKCESF